MAKGLRHAQDRIESLAFYLAKLDGLMGPQKIILGLVADCERRCATFQPSLLELARMCSCSRSQVWRALARLDGRDGWIKSEWRGGRKTNLYVAGWRLKRILQRRREPK